MNWQKVSRTKESGIGPFNHFFPKALGENSELANLWNYLLELKKSEESFRLYNITHYDSQELSKKKAKRK